MKPPIFIIGSPRSGTTLLRLMITSHRNIVVPPECGFAVWWKTKYENWNAAEHLTRLEEFITDFKQSKKIETWNLDYEAMSQFLLAQHPASYAELVSLIYTFYASARKPAFERWGDKNNFYLNHIAALDSMFPDAHFVHIIRDGRDVACSYRELAQKRIDSAYAPDLPTAISGIAREWKLNIETIRNSFAAINPGRTFEIRYEDLVSTPETTLQELCRSLGEEYDPGMMEYHLKNKAEQLEPAGFLQWKAKTLLQPVKEQAGRFRRELAGDEIGEFERIAGDLLRRYSYL